MARTHGRVSVSIWADADWLALPMSAQWLYLALVSQADINHAGIVSLTTKRWAQLCAERDPALIADTLKVLEEARFIVVDEDTEQVLVRTFMRNDGVAKQSNTLKTACASILLVRSPRIRAALLAELRRLDVPKIRSLRPSRADHPIPYDVYMGTVAALSGDEPDPSDRAPITPSDGYGSDGYGCEPIPRRRAGEGAGAGVGEVPVSRSEELSLGESPRPRRRPRTETPGQLPMAASVPARPDIPDRCPRCARLGLAPEDPGPNCPACGRLRQSRERRDASRAGWTERTAAEERAARQHAADDCDRCDEASWLLEYPGGPPVEPAAKCTHGLRLISTG